MEPPRSRRRLLPEDRRGHARSTQSVAAFPPLKITEVRTIVTNPGRNYVLVKILTSEPGTYGVGDATLNGARTRGRLRPRKITLLRC